MCSELQKVKRKLQEINTQILQECQKALGLKSQFKFDGFISSKRPDLRLEGLKGNSSRSICIGTPKASQKTEVTTKQSDEASKEDKLKAFRASFKGRKCNTNGFAEKDTKEEVDRAKNSEKKPAERPVTETKIEIPNSEKKNEGSIDLKLPFKTEPEQKNTQDSPEDSEPKIKSDNSIEEEAKGVEKTCHRPSRFRPQTKISNQFAEDGIVEFAEGKKGTITEQPTNVTNGEQKDSNQKVIEQSDQKKQKKPPSLKSESDDRPLVGEAFCTSSSEEKEKDSEEQAEVSLTSSKRNAQQELKKSRFFTAIPEKLKETKSDIIQQSSNEAPIEEKEIKAQVNFSKDDMKLDSSQKKMDDSEGEDSCVGDKFDLSGSDEEKDDDDESEKQTKTEGKKSNFNTQSASQVRESPPPQEILMKKASEPDVVFHENKNKNLFNPPNSIAQLDSDNSDVEEEQLPGEDTFEKILKEEKKSERSVSPPDLQLKSSFSNIEKGGKFWSNPASQLKREPAPMAPSQNIGLTSDNSLQSSSLNPTLDKEQRAKLFQSQRESFLLTNKGKASQTQIFGGSNTSKLLDNVQTSMPKGQGSIDADIRNMKIGKEFITKVLR